VRSQIGNSQSPVARCNRICSRSLIAISLLLSAVTFAQNRVLSSNEQGSADHGLKLIVSREPVPEPPDSSALKTCLVNHPSAACALLTLVLKNEGKETVLIWSGNCGSAGIGFDLKNPDGSWVPFPTAGPWVCSAILVVESLPPGKSSGGRLRLADPSLELDTAFPPHDGLPHTNKGQILIEAPGPYKGHVLIEGPGPYTIRANRYIWGCTASDRLKADTILDPSSAGSLCIIGTTPRHDFAILQSNEVELATKP
jgi:hypothetical protein